MKKLWFIAILLLAGCSRGNAPVSEATAPGILPTVSPVAEASLPQTQPIDIRVEATITPEPVQTLAPTPEPTNTPEPTETPEPTPAPTSTPEPTSTPLPHPVFEASLEMPLPTLGTQVQRSRYFWIDGTVSAGEPLILVRVEVLNGKGSVSLEAEQRFSPEENVRTVRLLDETFAKDTDAVANRLTFQKLPVGTYTLRIMGQDAASEAQVLAETQFKVTNESWLQLQPNNLRLNYTTALNFFGSPERFLFRYKFSGNSQKITIDPDWSKQYVGHATCLKGKKWECHVDAIPYFEQACRYMETTYIRVTGKNLDTGPVLLADLVGKMDGTMVRRFSNSGQFISHHSFGTAVDINAHYPSNKDNLTNRDKIFAEVQKLTYNGIVTIKNKPCYDFTYTGTSRNGGIRNVPEPLLNYFLYELAFYRAGFSWGVYYPHKSDAMHFTLTELSPALFTDGLYAMRKVFAYVEDKVTETPTATASADPS